ncbi:MAG TPA: polyribonucleotide nucleotidyltransferase [Candidatus Paceibacterota bacterium]|nr:polyribonucleotide nucleotidyltransferase [Candidatus Paceibacterota bacterium]
MQKQEFSIEIGGKTLTAEFNDLAMQANGSVIVRYGDTAVLATAVMGREERVGLDYFPLTVDYEERFYAAGQILGSRFMRREGRPSDEAVLSGRAIDRTIRPLFDSRMRVEVQLVLTILSLGAEDPDVLAIIAASLALSTSDIPWDGPVGAVRLGRKNGELIVNPTYEERESEMTVDMLVCGKNDLVNMIEVNAHEAGEADVASGFAEAQTIIGALESFQHDIIKEIGKEKKAFTFPQLSEEAKALFAAEIAPSLEASVFTGSRGKNVIGDLHDTWSALIKAKLPEENSGLAEAYFEAQVENTFDAGVLSGKRPDGRAREEIRPLYAQAGGIGTMIHGTGVFYRGETHVLSALTLGGPEDTQIVDGMEAKAKKRYMHHYNFPPFSTGETGRIGGTNRRMVGHGALAEKALTPVLPAKEGFPYTIRIVSEVLSSNGSSSMASVCGSTLALMDAGVPITRPVAGIAMGVVVGSHESSVMSHEYAILTDIQGPEDHYGDMDLKVAGTSEGITAMQMDVKVGGVSIALLSEALEQAKIARLQILDVITKEIPEPRATLPATAPRILVTKVDKEQIGLIIGSGGKTVNQIRDLTGAEISIEEDGTVFVTGKNGGAEEALRLIGIITREYAAGERFEGVVTRIMDFGAFVRISEETGITGMKDTEGLVHISEIAPFRIGNVRDAVAEGERVPVVIKEIDEMGRVNLSIKQADPEWATKKGLTPAVEPPGGWPERPPRPFGHRPPHHGGPR